MTARQPAGTLSPESLAAIRIVFFQECEEHIAAIETGLRALQSGDTDPETIATVHRAVHSIKGAAGIFELHELARFSRDFETVMVEVRDGRLQPGRETVGVLLGAAAVLAELVDDGRHGRAVAPDRTSAMLETLAALVPGTAEPGTFDSLDFEPRPMAFKTLPGES
jgi:two-component system, chemotaxis family, sensor kinase CheA